MIILVGLGNPGSKYQHNRHNIGFMAVDEIVHRHNFSDYSKKFQGLLSEGRIGSQKLLILKPQTYMNESGRSIGEAMRFYKLTPDDVFVFYDELDIAFGKIKVKQGGGHAGHNGIRSTINHIGADFHRIRLGIGHPGDKSKVHSHVLGDFNSSEAPEVDKLTRAIADEARWLADGDTTRFVSEMARQINPPRNSGQKNNQDATKPVIKAVVREKKDQPKEGPLADALRALKTKE